MLDFLKRVFGFSKPEQVAEVTQKVEAPVLITEPVVEPVPAPVPAPVLVVAEKSKKQPAKIKAASKPKTEKPKAKAEKPKAEKAPAAKKPVPTKKPRMKVAK